MYRQSEFLEWVGRKWTAFTSKVRCPDSPTGGSFTTENLVIDLLMILLEPRTSVAVSKLSGARADKRMTAPDLHVLEALGLALALVGANVWAAESWNSARKESDSLHTPCIPALSSSPLPRDSLRTVDWAEAW